VCKEAFFKAFFHLRTIDFIRLKRHAVDTHYPRWGVAQRIPRLLKSRMISDCEKRIAAYHEEPANPYITVRGVSNGHGFEVVHFCTTFGRFSREMTNVVQICTT
jgi:hypothetical protein